MDLGLAIVLGLILGPVAIDIARLAIQDFRAPTFDFSHHFRKESPRVWSK